MEINLNNLLCREPIKVDLTNSLKFLKNKRILITGAGGSIGSELCRQMLFAGAKRLFLLGHGEDSIYKIINELQLMQKNGHGDRTALVPVIGEMQDEKFVQFIMEHLKADVIFHTAAHKHVPMMEANPVECVKNNIFGTKYLVSAIQNLHFNKFIFISTDKAVCPKCVYGASKAISENIVLAAGKFDPRFLVVRFGNVIGSRGSVIPLWIDQIQTGGPITITHPNVKRFFMSIEEAVSLIIRMIGNGKGGSLYCLNMGEQLLAKTIAIKLIEKANLKVDEDIKIEYIGLRPGEKFEERLWSEEEEVSKTEDPNIFCVNKTREIKDLDNYIRLLRPICFYEKENEGVFRDKSLLRQYLRKIFPNLEMPKYSTKY